MNTLNIKIPKVLILLIICTFFREVIFSVIVPIWHTPDEQAHFAQVAYYSEFGKMPLTGNDLNKEIYISEELLGTVRDKNGDNKFTFHPEYRIEYTNFLDGKYENQIKTLPLDYRKELVGQEAANYPPLYYQISSVIYKLFYYSDLITRVYAVRYLSIIVSLCLVYVAWLIGNELFPESLILQVTLPLLVSFQPMVSFVSAGVTSDNLFNLLFTILVYFGVLIVKNGIKLKNFVLTVFVIYLMYLTKPQFVYALPILMVALLFSLKKWRDVLVSIILLLILIALFLVFKNNLIDLEKNFTYLYSFDPGYVVGFKINLSPIQYIKNTLIHTYAEVTPWYWGVFDWLSVALPHVVNRIINWLMILAGIGFVVRLFRIRSRKELPILFMFFSALIYFIGISYYDYLFILGHNFSFGIQGRYFFPTIVPQMAILLIGLVFLVPIKWKSSASKLIGFLMIILNFVAILVIANTYYDLTLINRFITQASQYKPALFKGIYLVLWLVFYLFSLGVFIYHYIKIKDFKLVSK